MSGFLSFFGFGKKEETLEECKAKCDAKEAQKPEKEVANNGQSDPNKSDNIKNSMSGGKRYRKKRSNKRKTKRSNKRKSKTARK